MAPPEASLPRSAADRCARILRVHLNSEPIGALSPMQHASPARIGRYVIIRPLGKGGMGAIFLARDPAIDRLVAVKLMREEFHDARHRDRFVSEAQSIGRLRHPNIVTVFDVGEHDGEPFIAMEYIEGRTLASVIALEETALTRKLQIIDEVCAGLHYAHRTGIVHRDVKPANIMVDTEGTVKILDFGLAQGTAAGLTQSGTILGTLNYMSPEQLLGSGVDHRTDIFAVGAVFYELLSGRRAFPGEALNRVLNQVANARPEPLSQWCPDLDPDLMAIVDRCLQKDLDRRYSELASVRQDVAGVQRRLDHSTRSDARSPPPFRGHAAASDAPTRQASRHYLQPTVTAVPARLGMPPRPAVRPSLRCDRTPQWTSVDDLATDGFNDLILIPGVAGQDHDHFVQRIQYLLRMDPPRSMLRIDWPTRPGSREEYLELLARPFRVPVTSLAAEIAERLSHENLILLHPCIRARFVDQTLVRYYTEWLPQLIAGRRLGLNLKCVQPIEWPRESRRFDQLLSWMRVRPSIDTDGKLQAEQLIHLVRRAAGPAMRVVRLEDLKDITDEDLDKFCELVDLNGEQRHWLLTRIRMRKPAHAKDVFQAIDDYLPDARSIT